MNLLEITKKNALFNKETSALFSDEDLITRQPWIFDFRTVLLDSRIVSELAEKFWSVYDSYNDLQIATPELAGVPLTSAILNLGHIKGKYVNGLIVRKSPKKSGLTRVIEGVPRQGVPTIVIDDLINSGGSIEKCILNLLEVGIQVKECFSILSFETQSFQKIKLKYKIESRHLYTLNDYGIESYKKNTDSFDLNSFTTRWVVDPRLQWNKSIIFCKSKPLVDGEIIYWGTDSNIFFANDVKTGKEIWRHTAPQKSFLKGIWSTPCSDEKNVYFGSYCGGLYALDKLTGELVWENINADFIGSSPALAQDLGMIFIGQEFVSDAAKGAVAAIDIKTGHMIWDYKTQLHVHSSPAYSKVHGLVFCGSNDADMLALDAKTGLLRWRTPIRGIVKMAAILDETENIVFGSSLDGRLYLFDAVTGNIIWTFATQKGLLAAPLVVGDLVVLGSCDNCLYIINYKTKELIKKFTTSGRFLASPSLINGDVFVANNAGVVLQIDLKKLEIVGQHQLPDRIPNGISYDAKNKHFFAHTCDDRLFCFTKDEITA